MSEDIKTNADYTQMAMKMVLDTCRNTNDVDDVFYVFSVAIGIVAGSLHFALNDDEKVTGKARSGALLRSMYENAQQTISNMTEEEFDAVSLRDGYVQEDIH